MSKFQISKENRALIQNSGSLYTTGSRAKLEGVTALIIATQNERIAALLVVAKNRPAVKDIQAAIRIEFGGASKEENRGKYEAASLAFRMLSKLEKEFDGELKAAIQSQNVAAFTDVIELLIGGGEEHLARAWVAGNKAKPIEKKPIEQVTAYLTKKNDELSDDDIVALSEMLGKEIAKRKRIASEIALQVAVAG